MCDLGRFGYHYVNSDQRITRPIVRRENGEALSSWEQIVSSVRKNLAQAVAADPASVAGMISPFLTCEEAYLLAKYLKGLSSEARLFLGPVPVVGEDDTYPKDRYGRPIQPVRFTIRAEKCPNRRGVEAILRHFQGELLGFDELVRFGQENKLKAVYFAAGYPPRVGGWITEEQAEKFKQVPLLIVQDLFSSPVSAKAKYVIPAATFAEKDGTFVNHAGLAQCIHWGIRPPDGVRPDGQVFLDLMERRGLVHAPSLRAELAREIPFFAALAQEPDDQGVFLEST
jgi:NADH-quinone oxidoreductase subunit G